MPSWQRRWRTRKERSTLPLLISPTTRRLHVATITHPLQADLRWFLGQAHAPKRRTMRQFAEQEVVIPDGPFAGRRFSCDRQPYTRLWLDQVDSGRWSRCVAKGPTQYGMTLTWFVIALV